MAVFAAKPLAEIFRPDVAFGQRILDAAVTIAMGFFG